MGGVVRGHQHLTAGGPALRRAAGGPLDARIIASLRELAMRSTVGTEGIRHLVETYLASTEKRAQDMQRAAGNGDVGALAQVAHSLAGSSASLGARELAEVCRSIEGAAAAAEVSALPELLRQMEGALAEARSSLRSELLAER